MHSNFPFRTRARLENNGSINSDHTYSVFVEYIGKSPNEESPYLIANEYIAGRIGQLLGLPIPAFSVVKKSIKDRMFVSHRYYPKKAGGIVPQVFYDKYPRLSAQIVLFDILIGNMDRHGRNIELGLGKLEQPYVIDHDRCLLGVFKKSGSKRLKEIKDKFGLSGSHVSTKDSHCLIQQLKHFEDIEEAINRICMIPDFFFDDITSNHKFLGITRTEANDVRDFLKNRKEGFGSLILENKSRFTKVNPNHWKLFL